MSLETSTWVNLDLVEDMVEELLTGHDDSRLQRIHAPESTEIPPLGMVVWRDRESS